MSRFAARLAVPVALALARAGSAGETGLPDDEFLEFLGGWDEAWEQTCDPAGYLPADEACDTGAPPVDDRDEDEPDHDEGH